MLAKNDGDEINDSNGDLTDGAYKRTVQRGGSVDNRCKYVIKLVQKLYTINQGRVSNKLTLINQRK